MEIKLDLTREQLEILIGLLYTTYAKEIKYENARITIIEQLEKQLKRKE